LAILDYGNGLNLCYHTRNATHVVIQSPENEDAGQLSGCVPWPRPGRAGGNVVFSIAATGSLGRTQVVATTRTFPGPATTSHPSPATTSHPSPAPSLRVAKAPPAPSIVAVVTTYYSDWNARRFPAMWQLLSPAFRAKTTYDTWLGEHTFNESIGVTGAKVTGTQQVTVNVVATAKGANGQLTSSTYRLTWTLVAARGGWLLDSYTQ
jgi:hypothetical protein